MKYEETYVFTGGTPPTNPIDLEWDVNEDKGITVLLMWLQWEVAGSNVNTIHLSIPESAPKPTEELPLPCSSKVTTHDRPITSRANIVKSKTAKSGYAIEVNFNKCELTSVLIEALYVSE